MPTYEITSPDGRTFQVTAPDGATQEQVLSYAQQNFKTGKPATAKAPDPSEGSVTFRPFGVDTGIELGQGASRFLAGTGKAFADLGRGVGQAVGAVDRQDVAESRKLDAPLMKTGAGVSGHIAGNVAALLPTAFIPGANTYTGAATIGAVTGALQPSVSTSETLQNIALGGLFAPAAIGAVRGAQTLYQGGKALIEPFTKSGQDRIAAEVLRRSATDPAKAAQLAGQAKELVPGSQPTLAQVAQDPGLAQLERAILNNAEYAPALQQRFGNQRAARLEAVKDVAGRGDHYDDIVAGRQLFAKQDYDAALKAGVDPKMAKAIAPQIQSLMERPSIQAAQKDAIRLAKESGIELSDTSSLQGLDWLKKALDNRISTASNPGSSIGKEDLRALVQTKNDLMATLEQIAPAYKEANKNYAAMSGQVNSMDVARSLLDKLNKPGSEYMAKGTAREMGDAYNSALSKSFDSVKKSTGMNKDITQVMSAKDIELLENVARDIGRKQFAENAGKATGSNTAQNLASQNMLRRVLGPTGLPETWAESNLLQGLLSPVQGASKLAGADRKIMDRIAQGLLDPMDGIGLLSAPARTQAMGLLAPNAQRYLPAMGLLANGER
jgi:hypothetical protein